MPIFFDKDEQAGGGLFKKKALSPTEKALVENYKESLGRIKKELLRLTEKYGKDGKLSYAEMAKYHRLDNLFKEIAQEVVTLTGKNGRSVAGISKKILIDSFEENTAQIQAAIDRAIRAEGTLNINWGTLNKDAVKAAVENPLFHLAQQDLKQTLINQLRKDITQSIISGESYFNLSKKIAGRMGVIASRALTIARTEAGKAYSQGQLDAHDRAEELGIVVNKVWVSTLDDRTRDTHVSMDGQKADKEGYFKYPGGGTTQAPRLAGPAKEVINCRCRFITVVEGYEPKTRIARTIEGNEKVKYQTAKDWKKSA